jgi:ubiquinone/menaquinone biosynthesis C-methylase UbiE
VTTDGRPANPFAADAVGALYAHGRPYHHPRSLGRVRKLAGADPLDRALDVACGTGMSTVALSEHAAHVVGVDVSPGMLGSSRTAPRVSYALGHAEHLPFPDDLFDAVTVCSGIHWFDQPRFFTETARVLRPGGWLALYDHYFLGEMVDVPEFAAWTVGAMERYPLPHRNPQVGDPRAETPNGFVEVGEDFFVDDIAMTAEELADYQITISNFVAAAERGTPREELREWVLTSTAPLFEGHETRVVRFLGSITVLRPEQPA